MFRRGMLKWRVSAAVTALFVLGMATPAPAAGPGVNGRVLALDAKGLPKGTVSGAKIEFKNKAGKVVKSVTTDKKGRYKVDLPPGTYTYKVQAAGFKDEDAARGITLTQTEGYAVYDLPLIRGKNDPKQKAPKVAASAVGTLKGRVVEKTADGKLVGVPRASIAFRKSGGKELAKVVAKGDTVQENGQFETTLDAGSYQASVVAAGFQPFAPKALAVAANKTVNNDFILTRSKQTEPTGQGIKGVITLASGKGLAPKVKLTVRPMSPAGAAVDPLNPDAKGGFQRDLRSGRYQVVAEAEGYRTATSDPKDVLAGKYTVVNLRLLPAPKSAAKQLTFVATVFERLPGRGGRKPLPGVDVLLRKDGEPLTSAVRGKTGTDGKVSLNVSGPGKYQAMARLKGYKPAPLQTEIRGAGDKPAELEMVRDVSLLALNLRILEGTGKLARPVSKARVAVSQGGRPVKTGFSDGDGNQSFTLPPGTYRIAVTGPGYAPAQSDITLSTEAVRRDITLTRQAPARVALILRVVERLKSGDKTVPGAHIVLSQNNKRVLGDKSGADGRLAVSLPPGSYTVAVTKPGYKPATVQVSLGPKETTRDILLLRAGADPGKKTSLTLRVVERFRSSDQAVAGAQAGFFLKDKRVLTNKTGDDGRLAVALPPGTYTAVVTKPGYKTANVSVTLAAADVKQDVVLTRAGNGTGKKVGLTLRVVEKLKSGDKALAGAQVAISQNDKRVLTDKTGDDGRLAVALPPGTYTAVVTKPGYKTANVSVTLAAADVKQDVVLTRAGNGTGKKVGLTLRVLEKLRSGDKALAGAQVAISQNDKRVLTDKTGDVGRLAVALPPGTYTAVVTKAGYRIATLPVTLAAQDVARDVPLTRAPIKKNGGPP